MDRDEKFLLGLLREKGVIYRSVPPPVSRLLVSCIGTIAGVWVGIIPVIWLLERRLHVTILFKEARREAPAVVFIDELDVVGTEMDGFSHERDQTLNQLLTEMDGFDSDKQVIVLAATNRAAALDPALLRPGRFSRKVFVGEPDLEGRKRIMAVHLRGVPLEEDTEVVCDLIASLTDGFVGADLANIANEAALLAVRRGGRIVTREDIMEAIEREKFGINDNKANAVSGSKALGKLFPWLPSLAQGSVKYKNRDRNAIGSRRVLST
ncbi:ATP-dependent zinc metalloprotease FtsH [Carex littledalei]|uniref:ATP-dependent zinc metalloprotease FtsH n=1 Tax=Carex littledalei TaxID=544730 RepID=A0A833RJW0_9POAL|nr:ATP-dependent zinc metalloprotease FtsH [Carex littledalei]